jgi:hypothetical protein
LRVDKLILLSYQLYDWNEKTKNILEENILFFKIKENLIRKLALVPTIVPF